MGRKNAKLLAVFALIALIITFSAQTVVTAAVDSEKPAKTKQIVNSMSRDEKVKLMNRV